jgi:hypothetical protein
VIRSGVKAYLYTNHSTTRPRALMYRCKKKTYLPQRYFSTDTYVQLLELVLQHIKIKLLQSYLTLINYSHFDREFDSLYTPDQIMQIGVAHWFASMPCPGRSCVGMMTCGKCLASLWAYNFFLVEYPNLLSFYPRQQRRRSNFYIMPLSYSGSST